MRAFLALALAACGSARLDLGRVEDACPGVAGRYAVAQSVSCGPVAGELDVRQEGCDLVFPGPSIEGSVQRRAPSRWGADALRVGGTARACVATYHPADLSLEIGCPANACYVVLARAGADGGVAERADGGAVDYRAFTYAGAYENVVVQKSDRARDLCVRLVLFKPFPHGTGSVFVLPAGWGVLEAEVRDSASDCAGLFPRPPPRAGARTAKSSGLGGQVAWTTWLGDGGAPGESSVPCALSVHVGLSFPAGSPSTSERLDADRLPVLDPDGLRPGCPEG